MSSPSVKLVRPAKLSELPEILAWIAGCVTAHGYSASRVSEVEVAAEEVLVNIMHYAYPDGNGTIEVTSSGNPPEDLILEFADTGRPFDVHSVPDPDLAVALEDKSIGGLGVFLMKRLINRIEYRRQDETNRLTFTIREAKNAAS